jgi:hypothetical protein
MFWMCLFLSCNFCLGAMEEVDDHLASRFGKSVDAVHRIAGLCQIIEFAWNIVEIFVQRHGGFEDHSISNEFLTKCELLFVELYGPCIEDNRRFYISIDVVERGIDIITGNLEQYKLLMFIPEHEGIHMLSTSNKPTDSLMINPTDKKDKKRLKFGQKSFEMEQAVLLFDSVLFTLSTLYKCRLLKNGAVVLRDVCDSLVNKQLLIKVDRATGSGTKFVTVYIKLLPDHTSAIECQRFINSLALLGNPSVTMETVLDTCRKIKYFCKKPPIQSVLQILNRPQYKVLNLDLTPLHHGKVCIALSKNVIELIKGKFFLEYSVTFEPFLDSFNNTHLIVSIGLEEQNIAPVILDECANRNYLRDDDRVMPLNS